ncbi:MAG: phosphoribosylformylglycinamidine cyclo-ligase [Lachnospiraceae bacterium]|nr:phosphoribosylformylglycinamidine cyclo-ligase [Lachnospiraceae bacterium]MDD7177686.1 phosphoribosylformylglycinamidine cyclo-ligase [bacterium]MDY5517671.1 phosphoribosylformylglycinamidine cyclo-ligase [Lachnospiraceae bacterium]
MRERLGLNTLTNEIPIGVYRSMIDPVLISKTHGVSGKLSIAAELERYDTIGEDCVAVCVNDLVAAGAKPLFFYDTISCARPKKDKIEDLEAGARTSCEELGIAYAGSEIMELPDIYHYDQYDMVGFAVGILDRGIVRDKQTVKQSDVIMGLASDGLHNNGYVAAKKKLFLTKASMEFYYENLQNTLGNLLMQPTRCYQKVLEAIYREGIAISHCVQVAHGGLDAAIRRLLPENCGAVIKQPKQNIPPLYLMLHQDGNMPLEQLRTICNMGIGMLFIVSEEDADRVSDIIDEAGERPVPLGLIEKPSGEIRYI